MTVECHLRTIVERRLERGVMWDGACSGSNLHSARWDVGPAVDDEPASIDYDDRTGTVCDRCGAPVPWDAPDVPCDCEPGCTETTSVLKRFGGSRSIYDTEDGKLQPGDMYLDARLVAGVHWCSGRWTNCDGQHLFVVLPNGHHWDVDSRANNCTLPDDFTHRCWVREGEPPLVTAGKDGHTCTAGAGSILSGDYHGFLRNGVLEP